MAFVDASAFYLSQMRRRRAEMINQDLIGNAARRQVTAMQPHRYKDVVLPVYVRFLPFSLPSPETCVALLL